MSRFLVVALLALTLSACAIVDGFKAETPRQAIASGYATIDVLATATTSAKSKGSLTGEQRDKVVGELRTALDNIAQAETSLRLFEASGSADAKTDSELRIRQAEAILKVVEALLQESIQ